MEITEKPLISFCLFAYNQEQYIKEAVEGALNQTYTPLEVILSDDCSTDNTFARIQEIVREYKGPHKVFLNRNNENLGLAEHINYVASIASGEWLVFAAGDDISFPERTESLYDSLQNRKGIFYVGSAYEFISLEGRKIGNYSLSLNKKIHFSGCSAFYHADCFKLFEKIPKDVVHEDWILPYRALLCGSVLIVDKPLLKYRLRIPLLVSQNMPKHYNVKPAIAALQQRERDLYNMKHSLPIHVFQRLLNDNNIRMDKEKMYLKEVNDFNYISTSNMLERLLFLNNKKNGSIRRRLRLYLKSSLFWPFFKKFLDYFRYININLNERYSGKATCLNIENILEYELKVFCYND